MGSAAHHEHGQVSETQENKVVHTPTANIRMYHIKLEILCGVTQDTMRLAADDYSSEGPRPTHEKDIILSYPVYEAFISMFLLQFRVSNECSNWSTLSVIHCAHKEITNGARARSKEKRVNCPTK